MSKRKPDHKKDIFEIKEDFLGSLRTFGIDSDHISELDAEIVKIIPTQEIYCTVPHVKWDCPNCNEENETSFYEEGAVECKNCNLSVRTAFDF